MRSVQSHNVTSAHRARPEVALPPVYPIPPKYETMSRRHPRHTDHRLIGIREGNVTLTQTNVADDAFQMNSAHLPTYSAVISERFGDPPPTYSSSVDTNNHHHFSNGDTYNSNASSYITSDSPDYNSGGEDQTSIFVISSNLPMYDENLCQNGSHLGIGAYSGPYGTTEYSNTNV